jgi:hypothetical protein
VGHDADHEQGLRVELIDDNLENDASLVGTDIPPPLLAAPRFVTTSSG